MLQGKNLSVTLCLLFLSISVFAQPQPYGCHYWRTLNGQGIFPEGMAEREINPSISKSDTFDILHYDITLDITNQAAKTIKGETQILFKAKLPNRPFIRFDFYHVTPDKKTKLTVDSVTRNGAKLGFYHDENTLQVLFSEIPEVDSLYELKVYYKGSPHRDAKWGGFIFDNGYTYNLGIGISTIPPNFGKVWYPCFDSFVERATYSYHIISAGKIKAHCQGNFTGEELISGDTVKRSYDFNYSIPTHIASIAAADYANIDFTHQGVYGKVPVRITALPGDTGILRSKFKNIGAAVDACEFWYGPNPYSRVGYVTTTQGAMEIPENIAYPSFMTTQSNVINEALYSHELGHYWWGDWVSPFSHNDMWLKEGPAEYTSHLMAEKLSGKTAFANEVKGNQYTVLSKAHINDKGFWPLSPVPDAAVYGNHTYYKGAAVFHNLRGYLGDSLFRKGLRKIQEKFSNTTITPLKLRDSLESYTGIELDDFFNDHVFSPGFATFDVDSFFSKKSGNQWQTDVYIRQFLRKAPSFHKNVPLDVTLVSSDNQRFDHVINTTGEYTSISLQSPFQPSLVILNGHNRLNQCRLDHEFTLFPGEKLAPTNLPFVDFRISADSVSDTTLVRIEHIWSGPDTTMKAPGIYQAGSTHYWNVNGNWPDKIKLNGRVSYKAVDEEDLDFLLFKKNEAKAILMYRESPAYPWAVYKDITPVPGSLTNGAGYININILRKGQYTFANGDINIGLETVEKNETFRIYPNPAKNTLSIEFSESKNKNRKFHIYSIDGRIVNHGLTNNTTDNQCHLQIDFLDPGVYFIQFSDEKGRFSSKSKFIKL